MSGRVWAAVGLCAVAAATGCTRPGAAGGSGPPDASAEEATGTVGARLVIPGGLTIASARYVLTNGTTTLTGTIDVGTSDAISFVVGGVPSGSGYTLQLTAVTTDGTVTCTGTSAPFAVADRQNTAVNVSLVCAKTQEAGSILVGGNGENCPVWNTIVANPSVVYSGTGGASLLTASAMAPNAGALAFTWLPPFGATISGQSVTGNTATATFECGSFSGDALVTLVVSDGPLPDGGSCPATDTTGSVVVTCIPPGKACIGIGSGYVATPDTSTGACPPGQVNTGSLLSTSGDYCCSLVAGEGCDPSSLAPCTTPGQSCCVPCTGSAGGLCAPTEALLVAHDIANGNASAAGESREGCVACLLQAGGCLDNVPYSETNHECGDLTGAIGSGARAGTPNATLCLDTVACILGSSCAAGEVATCFCGSAQGSAACSVSGAANGACLEPEADGFGLPPTQAGNILSQFTFPEVASGMANKIFECAFAVGCSTCLVNANAAACPRIVSGGLLQPTVESGPIGMATVAESASPGSLVFTWSAPAGTIADVAQAPWPQQPADMEQSTATFTCPPTGGAVPVTVVVTDSSLASSCPTATAGINTETFNVNCGVPLGDAGAPVDAGTDAAMDAPFVGDGSFGACDGSSALVPCTAPGQSCCVPCRFSAGGLCTETEALFVAHDIASGKGMAAGEAANACYTCMVNGGCIDDVPFDDTNHECDDMTGTFGVAAGAGVADLKLCLDTMSCILASSCASKGEAFCYCGTSAPSQGCYGNPAAGPINGACVAPISAGLGFASTDGTDILDDFNDITKPAGRALEIFQCAIANSCSACLQ